MNSPTAKTLGGEDPVAVSESLRQGCQTGSEQRDQQHPAIADLVALIAEEWGGNDIGKPGDGESDAAQRREVGPIADQLLHEQRHHGLHRAHPELRHQQHEK